MAELYIPKISTGSSGSRLFDDASSQYLNLNKAVLTGPPMTINVWFNLNHVATDQTFASIQDTAGSSNFYRLMFRGVGDFIRWQAFDGAAGSIETTTSCSANSWYMATGVEYATNSRVAFLNGGGKDTPNTRSITPTGLDSTSIGALAHSAPFAYMSGMIAHLAMWNTALTDAEIRLLYLGHPPWKIRPQRLVFYEPLGPRARVLPDHVNVPDYRSRLTENNGPIPYDLGPPMETGQRIGTRLVSYPSEAPLAIASGTGAFSEDADGDIVGIAVASATGDFTEDADGDVAVIAPAIGAATGNFTENADGTVISGILEPTATGDFNENADGVVFSATLVVASGSGDFTEDSDGTVNPIFIASATGDFVEAAEGNVLVTAPVVASATGAFAENAEGNVLVLTLAIGSATGDFTENADGNVTETGVATGSATGAFTEASEGNVLVAQIVLATATGDFTESAEGQINVQAVAIATGAFTEDSAGLVQTVPIRFGARRTCPVPSNNRSTGIDPRDRTCPV